MLDKKNSPKIYPPTSRKQIYYKIMEDYNLFNAKYIVNWVIIRYFRSTINAYSPLT